MPGRTCSGLSSPGGTAATFVPWLPNSMVESVLMVSPFFGDTKKTRPAEVDDEAGGASAPLQAAATIARAASATLPMPRFLIVTPFVSNARRNYTLLARRGSLR